MDTFIEDICYGRHFFCAPREHFGQNLPLNSRQPMIGWENENNIKNKTHACFYLTQVFTLTRNLLSNFSKLFFTSFITFASPQRKVYRFLESQSNTTIDSLSSHLYTNAMICKLK